MSMLIIANALYQGQMVDLCVDNGRVLSLTASGKESNPAGAERHDAAGRILFPSFIDAHAHLRDPGFTWKEDVVSGLTAAAHGGFGVVMCMPNTDPVNDDPAVTRQILEKAGAARPHGPRICPIGALSVGLRGEGLAPYGELAEAGCVAVSNDGLPVADAELFRRAMEYAADFGLFVIDHCEDPCLSRKTVMNEGLVSGRIGVKGQPDVAETIQVARDVLLAEYLGLPVHIAHVSCRRSLDVIAWAKDRGIKVTAETCPHYLLLDDSSLASFNTNAKVNPPLRARSDAAALRQAVKSGLIDILVTDHAPHAAHEKEHPLDQAPSGFTGLDTALAVSWELVRQGALTEADFIRLWCAAPGRLFNVPVNDFKPGAPADFFLFDPHLQWQVRPENLHSKSCNSPWLGQTLTGRVTGHWLGGVNVA
ncbi:MAG: dihydroorotase [Deltaproteobacteria bacterium]|jgi:dihydroorotase|nr:dihydroorotase [Deltaproteobacteria bacterium]